MGELLAEMPKASAGRPSKIGTTQEPISPPTLAEQGITGGTVMAMISLTNPGKHRPK
jgi:hypothetical protein